jgi:hypothetical protein
MKKLEVRLRREPGQERIVGQLAETGPRPAGGPAWDQLIFEYDPAFLHDPLWLSPFKLPPQSGLIEHRDLAFGPIFGLFAAAAARWRVLARRTGVGPKSAKRVEKAIGECLARL